MMSGMSRRSARAPGAILGCRRVRRERSGSGRGRANAERPAPSVGGATVGTSTTGSCSPPPSARTGCGTNAAGEPAIHVSRANNVFLGSELGVGGGSELLARAGRGGRHGRLRLRSGIPRPAQRRHRAPGAPAATSTSRSPSAKNATGELQPLRREPEPRLRQRRHLHRQRHDVHPDPGAGGPAGRRPRVDRRRSAPTPRCSATTTSPPTTSTCCAPTTAAAPYTQIAQVIPDTDYKAQNNELGQLVIDHRNLPDTTGGFYAYQAFVAPSSSVGHAQQRGVPGRLLRRRPHLDRPADPVQHRGVSDRPRTTTSPTSRSTRPGTSGTRGPTTPASTPPVERPRQDLDLLDSRSARAVPRRFSRGSWRPPRASTSCTTERPTRPTRPGTCTSRRTPRHRRPAGAPRSG